MEKKSVLFKSHFSEHPNTESGVQEFSLKTVTLQNLEQLSELVNFLEVFKVSGGQVFVHRRKWFKELFNFVLRLSRVVVGMEMPGRTQLDVAFHLQKTTKRYRKEKK